MSCSICCELFDNDRYVVRTNCCNNDVCNICYKKFLMERIIHYCIFSDTCSKIFTKSDLFYMFNKEDYDDIIDNYINALLEVEHRYLVVDMDNMILHKNIDKLKNLFVAGDAVECESCENDPVRSILIGNISNIGRRRNGRSSLFTSTSFSYRGMRNITNIMELLLKMNRNYNDENWLNEVRTNIDDCINIANNIIKLDSEFNNRYKYTEELFNNISIKCPKYDCNGYSTIKWKCSICKVDICKYCGSTNSGDHECNDSDKKSFELIKLQSKSCPNCRIPIAKIEGCNQMWCTLCNTAFSYNSGHILNSNILFENPHYEDYIKSTNKSPIVTEEQVESEWIHPSKFEKHPLLHHLCTTIMTHFEMTMMSENSRFTPLICEKYRNLYMYNRISYENYIDKCKECIEDMLLENDQNNEMISLLKSMNNILKNHSDNDKITYNKCMEELDKMNNKLDKFIEDGVYKYVVKMSKDAFFDITEY